MRRTCTICSSRIRAGRSSITNPAAASGFEIRSFELVVIRHGRTAWNAAGRYQGHSDIPLDDVGRAQAADIGRALAELAFDYAVTSDLVRARETAEIVLGTRDCALECDARWRELHFGAWEGLTRAEVAALLPLEPDPAPSHFPTPAGGEAFADFNLRVEAALRSLRERMRGGGRALVATHAGPLHAILRELLGEAEATALGVRFVPASITTFVVEPGGARLETLNRTAPPSAQAGAEPGRE